MLLQMKPWSFIGSRHHSTDSFVVKHCSVQAREADLIVPPPGFRVDGLTNSAQDAQAAALVLGDRTIPLGHQASDGCGGSVQH